MRSSLSAVDELGAYHTAAIALRAAGASPGAEDYISAARQHARLAEEHNSRARQHQDAARVLAWQGDEVGANIIEGAATADEWAARREMLHCRKDVLDQ
jgi:hypothetical protein